MIFRYGKRIFDKIMDKARPTFEDEKPVNVFDLWEGAEFKLRMRRVEGYPNYDQSTFSDPKPIASNDEEILAIVNKQYRLNEFLDRKNFKSYDELKTKLDTVLSGEAGVSSTAASIAENDEPIAQPQQFTATQAPEPVSKPEPSIHEDSDDVMSYFQSIADEE